MNNIYDTYYELLSEKNKNLKNELIFEEGKSASKEIYKFKFSALNGADELNSEGKKALNAIKNIIETSDNGKLYDLINLKINEYLKVIESSFGGSEEESIEEPDSSSDDNENSDENETLDDNENSDENENNNDELAEEPSEENKSKDDDDELAEDSPDEKTNDNDELAEEPSEENKSKDDDDELDE
jgi:hypothetical protein